MTVFWIVCDVNEACAPPWAEINSRYLLSPTKMYALLGSGSLLVFPWTQLKRTTLHLLLLLSLVELSSEVEEDGI